MTLLFLSRARWLGGKSCLECQSRSALRREVETHLVETFDFLEQILGKANNQSEMLRLLQSRDDVSANIFVRKFKYKWLGLGEVFQKFEDSFLATFVAGVNDAIFAASNRRRRIFGKRGFG